MASILEAARSKKLGLPNFRSRSYIVSQTFNCLQAGELIAQPFGSHSQNGHAAHRRHDRA